MLVWCVLLQASQCLEVFQAKKFTLSVAEVQYQEALQNSKAVEGDDMSIYSFDFTKPTTRWALAEAAKGMQHIANISCLPKEEMHVSTRHRIE